MKSTRLVYTTTAKLTRPVGEVDAWRTISVTLPWLSILSNDPTVPKPRLFCLTPRKPRKRLNALRPMRGPMRGKISPYRKFPDGGYA